MLAAVCYFSRWPAGWGGGGGGGARSNHLTGTAPPEGREVGGRRCVSE
jgi:hypothetical protein